MHFIYMDFGWDFHFFLIIMSSGRKSKSDGSESLKSFQKASIFPPLSWIVTTLISVESEVCLNLYKKSLFCWCVKVSRAEVIAHGSCRRFLWKLPHITTVPSSYTFPHITRVPLDSSRVPHHIARVPPSYTLKLPQITRMPPTLKGCQITSKECHPHHKGARSHHKGARSHHKSTRSHHKGARSYHKGARSHHKSARSHHKGARSHHTSAIVIHFFSVRFSW